PVDDARRVRLDRVDDERRVLVRAAQRNRLSAGQLIPHVRELRQVRLAAADVLVDGNAVALDLLVVPHEPRHVLRRVLARFGREEAEPLVERDADAPLQLGVGGDALVERRVEALAFMLEAQDERLVVHAGGDEDYLLRRYSDDPRELLDGELDGVAEADDA